MGTARRCLRETNDRQPQAKNGAISASAGTDRCRRLRSPAPGAAAALTVQKHARTVRMVRRPRAASSSLTQPSVESAARRQASASYLMSRTLPCWKEKRRRRGAAGSEWVGAKRRLCSVCLLPSSPRAGQHRPAPPPAQRPRTSNRRCKPPWPGAPGAWYCAAGAPLPGSGSDHSATDWSRLPVTTWRSLTQAAPNTQSWWPCEEREQKEACVRGAAGGCAAQRRWRGGRCSTALIARGRARTHAPSQDAAAADTQPKGNSKGIAHHQRLQGLKVGQAQHLAVRRLRAARGHQVPRGVYCHAVDAAASPDRLCRRLLPRRRGLRGAGDRRQGRWSELPAGGSTGRRKRQAWWVLAPWRPAGQLTGSGMARSAPAAVSHCSSRLHLVPTSRWRSSCHAAANACAGEEGGWRLSGSNERRLGCRRLAVTSWRQPQHTVPAVRHGGATKAGPQDQGRKSAPAPRAGGALHGRRRRRTLSTVAPTALGSCDVISCSRHSAGWALRKWELAARCRAALQGSARAGT